MGGGKRDSKGIRESCILELFLFFRAFRPVMLEFPLKKPCEVQRAGVVHSLQMKTGRHRLKIENAKECSDYHKIALT